MIEFIYVFCGLLLPAFYIPQILRVAKDQSKLAGYSLGKSVSQLILRIPALIFAVFIIEHPLMNLVVGLDVLGRAIELGVAFWSMQRQGVSIGAITSSWATNLHPLSVGWRRLASGAVACGCLAVFVSHAIDDDRPRAHSDSTHKVVPSTGGYLDSQ